MLELKVYCDPDKFYVRSKFGQYDKEKNSTHVVHGYIGKSFTTRLHVVCIFIE